VSSRTFAAFSAIAALTGCATETADADASGAAISGAPGPALDRAEAERRSATAARFAAAIDKERLLARVADARSGDFDEVLHPLFPYLQDDLANVPVFRGHPARRDGRAYDDHAKHVEAGRLQVEHESAFGAAGFGDRAFNAGGRVVLRCTNVAASDGPDPARCSTPAAGRPEAELR